MTTKQLGEYLGRPGTFEHLVRTVIWDRRGSEMKVAQLARMVRKPQRKVRAFLTREVSVVGIYGARIVRTFETTQGRKQAAFVFEPTANHADLIDENARRYERRESVEREKLQALNVCQMPVLGRPVAVAQKALLSLPLPTPFETAQRSIKEA